MTSILCYDSRMKVYTFANFPYLNQIFAPDNKLQTHCCFTLGENRSFWKVISLGILTLCSSFCMCVTVLQRSIVLQKSLNSEAVQILTQKYIIIQKYIWILKYRSWIYFVNQKLRKNIHKCWLGLSGLDLDIGPLWNHFLYLNKWTQLQQSHTGLCVKTFSIKTSTIN